MTVRLYGTRAWGTTCLFVRSIFLSLYLDHVLLEHSSGVSIMGEVSGILYWACIFLPSGNDKDSSEESPQCLPCWTPLSLGIQLAPLATGYCRNNSKLWGWAVAPGFHLALKSFTLSTTRCHAVKTHPWPCSMVPRQGTESHSISSASSHREMIFFTRNHFCLANLYFTVFSLGCWGWKLGLLQSRKCSTTGLYFSPLLLMSWLQPQGRPWVSPSGFSVHGVLWDRECLSLQARFRNNMLQIPEVEISSFFGNSVVSRNVFPETAGADMWKSVSRGRHVMFFQKLSCERACDVSLEWMLERGCDIYRV